MTPLFFSCTCALAIALFGCARKAHGDIFDSSSRNDSLDNVEVLNEQLLSPKLIHDNNLLFLAAEAERDASMDYALKVQNNYWLLHKGRPSESEAIPFRVFSH